MPKGLVFKWVYKTKLNKNWELEKHKTCLIAKSYAQQYRVNYIEVFAPMKMMDTLRMIITLTA